MEEKLKKLPLRYIGMAAFLAVAVWCLPGDVSWIADVFDPFEYYSVFDRISAILYLAWDVFYIILAISLFLGSRGMALTGIIGYITCDTFDFLIGLLLYIGFIRWADNPAMWLLAYCLTGLVTIGAFALLLLILIKKNPRWMTMGAAASVCVMLRVCFVGLQGTFYYGEFDISLRTVICCLLLALAVFCTACAIGQGVFEKKIRPAMPVKSPAPARKGGDVVSRLASLNELREKGIITDEEFAAKKKELLGQ